MLSSLTFQVIDQNSLIFNLYTSFLSDLSDTVTVHIPEKGDDVRMLRNSSSRESVGRLDPITESTTSLHNNFAGKDTNLIVKH